MTTPKMIYTVTKDNQPISSGETMPSNLEPGEYTVTVSKGPWPQIGDTYHVPHFSCINGATCMYVTYRDEVRDKAAFECGLARQTEAEIEQLIRRLKATATLVKRRDELGGRRSDGQRFTYMPYKDNSGKWRTAYSEVATVFGFIDERGCDQLCAEHPNELDIFYGND